jgi:hypothetical protein
MKSQVTRYVKGTKVTQAYYFQVSIATNRAKGGDRVCATWGRLLSESGNVHVVELVSSPKRKNPPVRAGWRTG